MDIIFVIFGGAAVELPWAGEDLSLYSEFFVQYLHTIYTPNKGCTRIHAERQGSVSRRCPDSRLAAA